MKQISDKIQFESRNEVSEVMSALDTFIEEHKGAKEIKAVKRLNDLLDVIYMSW